MNTTIKIIILFVLINYTVNKYRSKRKLNNIIKKAAICKDKKRHLLIIYNPVSGSKKSKKILKKEVIPIFEASNIT